MKTKIFFIVVGNVYTPYSSVEAVYKSQPYEKYEDAEKHLMETNMKGEYQIQKIYLK